MYYLEQGIPLAFLRIQEIPLLRGIQEKLLIQHIVSSGLKIAAGGEYQFEDGEEEGLLVFGDFLNPTSFSLDRSIGSGFVDIISEPIDSLLFRAGVRVDKPESFSTRASPSASLAYTLEEQGLTIFGKYGEGFKLPSFFALGNSIVGNPGLRPETSETYEVGLKQVCSESNSQIKVSWFHTTYHDAIDFDEGPPPLLINQSEIVSQGFELSSNIEISEPVELILSAAYVDSEIKDSTDQLRNRPDWRGSLGLNIKPSESTKLNVLGRYTSSRFDSSIPNPAVTLDSFIVVDSNFSWQLSETYQVWLAVNNLFDEDYQHFDGFPAQGINARAGIGAEF